MALFTYNARMLVISFSNAPIQGFGPDDFVTIAQDNKTYDHVVGADGDATRFATNDESGTVTVTTMQSSPANDILSGILRADRLDPLGGAGVGVLHIEDLTGTSLYHGRAWISAPPEAGFGRGVKTREWIFRHAGLDQRNDGSNINVADLP